jgi:hypothetical protein
MGDIFTREIRGREPEEIEPFAIPVGRDLMTPSFKAQALR